MAFVKSKRGIVFAELQHKRLLFDYNLAFYFSFKNGSTLINESHAEEEVLILDINEQIQIQTVDIYQLRHFIKIMSEFLKTNCVLVNNPDFYSHDINIFHVGRNYKNRQGRDQFFVNKTPS